MFSVRYVLVKPKAKGRRAVASSGLTRFETAEEFLVFVREANEDGAVVTIINVEYV